MHNHLFTLLTMQTFIQIHADLPPACHQQCPVHCIFMMGQPQSH